MLHKQDWPEARRRLTALWRGERLDRPCLAVRAPHPAPACAPAPVPADDQARWLDPGYVVADARRQLETTWWGGESLPSVLMQGGWVNCLGGEPKFSGETIWFTPRPVDFRQPSPFRHDWDGVWARKYRALLRAMCEAAGRNDFLIGSLGGLPANDLISMHLGAEVFLTALMDHPDWMADAILRGAREQAGVCRDLRAWVRERHDFWYGNAGWMPFWAPEPYNATQSDVSCMLSPEMFDRFIVPELDVHGEEYGALWYHLDGGDARQHLPRLLSRPYVRVIQYVPTLHEPPNGPGHLDLYRRIQAAGRIVHIDVPPAHVEPLTRALDPARLMLQTWCASRDEGERLLERSVEWARNAPYRPQ
jgi:hypothetical protein